MNKISTLLLAALAAPGLLWAQIPAAGQNIIRDIAPPSADISYSSTEVRCGDDLLITAIFDEPMTESRPVYLQMDGAVSEKMPMIRIGEDLYIFIYSVPGEAGTVSLSLSNGADLRGNEVSPVPNSGKSFEIVAQNLTTGPEMNGLPGVRVYPNPVADLLKIEGLADRTEARIYSSDGQLQQTRILENAFEEVDVSAVSAGFYILRMDTGGITGWRRFVKD